MSSSPLEAIVKHDGRLDVLCCLVDEQSLAVSQLSARTGKSARIVSHHLKLLGSFDLVEKDCSQGEEPLYTATLDQHPDWVLEAVEQHRCRD